MKREHLADLASFLTVAHEQSYTRAALEDRDNPVVPSHRHKTPAFTLLVDALRHRS